MYFNIEVKVVTTPIQFDYNLNYEISFNSFLLHNYYYLLLCLSIVFVFFDDSDKCIKYFENIHIIFLNLTLDVGMFRCVELLRKKNTIPSNFNENMKS